MPFIKLHTTIQLRGYLTYNFQNIEMLYQSIRFYVHFLFETVLLEQCWQRTPFSSRFWSVHIRIAYKL